MGLRPRLLIVVTLVGSLGLLAILANWLAFAHIEGDVSHVLGTTLPNLRDGLKLMDALHRQDNDADSFPAVTNETDHQTLYKTLQDNNVTIGHLIEQLAQRIPDNLRERLDAVLNAITEESQAIGDKLALMASYENGLAAIMEIDDNLDKIDAKQSSELLDVVLTAEDVVGTLFRLVAQKKNDATTLKERVDKETRWLVHWQASTPPSPVFAEILDIIPRLAPLASGPNNIIELYQRINQNQQTLALVSATVTTRIEALTTCAMKIVSQAENEAEQSSRLTGKTFRMAWNSTAVIIPLAFCVTLLVMWIVMGHTVVHRLVQLNATTRRLAKGELKAEITVHGQDEISEISESLVQFRQWAIDKHQVEEELKKSLIDAEFERDQIEAQANKLVTLAEELEEQRLAAVAARQDAQENRDHLKCVLDSIPDAIILFDPTGIIHVFSPAAQRLFGYEPAEIIGRSLEAMMPTENLGKQEQHHIISRHADGTPLPIDIRINEAEIGGLPLLVSSIRDARERLANEAVLLAAKKQAESSLIELKQAQHSLIQAEKLASLGALVAGVAHEINTPLSNSLTSASTLLNETTYIRTALLQTGVRKSELNQFFANAEQLARLILSNMQRAADLVTSFKRLSVDQCNDMRRVFNVRRCIDDVLFSLQAQLRPQGCTVTVECADTLELDSFPGALSQVLTNLFTNALLHAFSSNRPGRIVLTVLSETPSSITITFTDNGIGITPENLSRIFDPFFTTKRNAGGSGLGLHLVYNLITTSLAGRISVKSELGRGTVFTIVLPRFLTMPSVRKNGDLGCALQEI